jgi:hypothetical protein
MFFYFIILIKINITERIVDKFQVKLFLKKKIFFFILFIFFNYLNQKFYKVNI